MKKLKIGYKDRSPKKVEIEGVVFLVKPMAQEIMTSLAMFTNGMRDTMMNLEQKKQFIRSHVVGWTGMYFEDGTEFEYTDQSAVEYLTDEDYDDLFMMIYWESVKLANEKEEEIVKNKEKTKK